jgi:hypothetical protein
MAKRNRNEVVFFIGSGFTGEVNIFSLLRYLKEFEIQWPMTTQR